MATTLYQRWLDVEASFHPHERGSSPFYVTSNDFRQFGWLPVVTTIGYLVSLGWGLRKMQARKPYDLTKSLAAWNFFLAAFSAVGFSRTAPKLISNVLVHPFSRSICHPASDDWGRGPAGLWVQLFILSKFAERASRAVFFWNPGAPVIGAGSSGAAAVAAAFPAFWGFREFRAPRVPGTKRLRDAPSARVFGAGSRRRRGGATWTDRGDDAAAGARRGLFPRA